MGVTALLTSRRKTFAPYEREAARLLQDRAAANHLGSACITFSEEGMSIAADGVDAIYQVPYGEITFALETEDLLIIIVSNRATILQKADLLTGTFSQLREFLRQQVLYTNIEAPEQAKPAGLPGWAALLKGIADGHVLFTFSYTGLPPGITGFFGPEGQLVQPASPQAFRTLCHGLARESCGQVLGTDETLHSKNFYAGMLLLPAGTLLPAAQCLFPLHSLFCIGGALRRFLPG